MTAFGNTTTSKRSEAMEQLTDSEIREEFCALYGIESEEELRARFEEMEAYTRQRREACKDERS